MAQHRMTSIRERAAERRSVAAALSSVSGAAREGKARGRDVPGVKMHRCEKTTEEKKRRPELLPVPVECFACVDAFALAGELTRFAAQPNWQRITSALSLSFL